MYIPRPWLAVLGALEALLVAGAAFLAFRQPPQQPVQILLPAPRPPSELRVYVSGAVASPGIYMLAQGDRANDAVEAAGGTAQDADLERINLAAPLRDGDHVSVPRRGEAAAPSGAGGPRININAADQRALEGLPGIGEARARRIIESRNSEGPFRTSWELLERRLIPASLFDQLQDRITAY